MIVPVSCLLLWAVMKSSWLSSRGWSREVRSESGGLWYNHGGSTLDLSKTGRQSMKTTQSMKGKMEEPKENTLKKCLFSGLEKQKLRATITKTAKSWSLLSHWTRTRPLIPAMPWLESVFQSLQKGKDWEQTKKKLNLTLCKGNNSSYNRCSELLIEHFRNNHYG